MKLDLKTGALLYLGAGVAWALYLRHKRPGLAAETFLQSIALWPLGLGRGLYAMATVPAYTDDPITGQRTYR